MQMKLTNDTLGDGWQENPEVIEPENRTIAPPFPSSAREGFPFE
jgi:hypothetical protein